MRMMRCLGELTINYGGGYKLDLWPSTTTQPCEVDFDRVLAEGVTVAKAVEGLEQLFEPVKVKSGPASVPVTKGKE